MDWDDEQFSRTDFASHFNSLKILNKNDHTIDELLERTSTLSRTGQEFSFKPVKLSIGCTIGSQFYCGFQADVERHGINPHTSKPLPSSFWIRFKEEWFQIRACCTGYSSLTYSPYECHIPFRDVIPGGIKLRALYREESDRVTAELSIQSRRPARYTHYLPIVLQHGVEAIFDRHATEADFHGHDIEELDAGIVHAVEHPEQTVNVGLWTTHRLLLDVTARQYKIVWMCMVRLRMLNLFPDFNDATVAEPPPIPIPRWSSFEATLARKPFEIRYLVEALLSHGTVSLPEVEEMLQRLARFSSSRRSMVLEGLFAWTRRGNIATDITEVYRRMSTPKVPDLHLTITRRCLVTPTKCVLMPPAPETSNSLLRRFKDFQNRFLRVQFVDDDGEFPVKGETLIIDDNLQGREGVFARVRRTLKYGLHIAGRQYIFLTFSESQVREYGCWMIAETGTFTVENVLRSMGDLTRERIVAKHAARQSLALSTSRAIRLDVKTTRDYPDIQRNGYTFTDGAGQFTQKLADECARVLGYTSTPISAVQFRDGGVKGVLSVVKDPQLGDFEIRERNSMVKIYSEYHDFCVMKAATYSKATLNRQAIILMEALGVPKETFMDIFHAEKTSIEGLESGFAPERLAAATVFPLKQAFVHRVVNDPFVDAVTSLVKCRLLTELKWKAWIEISDSAFLMGVPDETNALGENEVFCQIHPPNGTPQVVTGQCLIYRNPCLHPGDVRLVTAVDCPSLRHLRNVIVFNVCGDRDLPNMLSGGDLDGDMYSLIWDPRLLIKPENMYEPMDYTPPIPEYCSSPVTIEQTKDHFVNFIKHNTTLGRVCNAHMALADQYGPEDFECQTLAGLASKAVDFCKTGVPVSQMEIPRIEEYPDFMGKNYKSIRVFKKQELKSYKSQKALGLMFREIDPEPSFNAPAENDWTTHGDPRLLTREDPSCYTTFLEAAAKHKIKYEFELEGLLRRYNISEVECVAGLLFRSPKTRVKVEKDYDIRIAVREAYAHVAANARDRTRHYLTEHPSGQGEKIDRMAWALAAYKLTYDSHGRFSEYLKVRWSAYDFGDTDEEDIAEQDRDDIEEEFKSMLDTEDTPASFARRFSFAWLLADEVFSLLGNIDGST